MARGCGFFHAPPPCHPSSPANNTHSICQALGGVRCFAISGPDPPKSARVARPSACHGLAPHASATQPPRRRRCHAQRRVIRVRLRGLRSLLSQILVVPLALSTCLTVAAKQWPPSASRRRPRSRVLGLAFSRVFARCLSRAHACRVAIIGSRHFTTTANRTYSSWRPSVRP